MLVVWEFNTIFLFKELEILNNFWNKKLLSIMAEAYVEDS